VFTARLAEEQSANADTLRRYDDLLAASLGPVEKYLSAINDKIRDVQSTLVQARQPECVDSAGWRAIDAAEIARGDDDGRPRNKFTFVADMLAAAATAPQAPPRGRRLLARLRELA